MAIEMKQLCQIYGTDVEPNPQDGRVYDSREIAMCHPANLPSGSYLYLVEVKNGTNKVRRTLGHRK